MYDIEIKLASKKGWYTPAEAKKYYGKYARTGITIHWWGDGTGASNHDNIVNYLNGRAAQGRAPTVNYVVSDNKITMCVSPENVAWTSGNGNSTTVGIEIQPTLSAEGYKKMGWLIWDLEERFGRTLQLFPHNHWMSTQCPGTLSLDRMRQEANRWSSGDYSPAPPVATPPKVLLDFKQITPATFVFNKDITNLYQVDKQNWSEIGVIKSFPKNERIDIFGVVKNNTLGVEWYITKYSFDNKLPNGFSKADLDPYVAPVPPAATDPIITPITAKLMYTLPNAKLVNIKDLSAIKTYSVDGPVQVVATSSYKEFDFYLTQEAVEKNNLQGFLIGDLKDEPTPVEPTPTQPEWIVNLQDKDDTSYWLTKEQKLIDITTGKPALVNGAETTFNRNAEFVSSALTRVGSNEYRITDYSFKKSIFNGVPIGSLTLTPPGQPNIDPIPNPPVVPVSVVLAFLESIVQAIQAFISTIKK